MKLSKLVGNNPTLTFPYDDEWVSFTYRSSEVTLDWLQEAEELETSEQLAEALEKVLIEWDVMDAHDERIAPTAAFIRTLPLRFMRAVFREIQEDGSLGEAKGRRSHSGSQRQAN